MTSAPPESCYSKTEIYTDGSCHTQLKLGAWVAIIFTNHNKTIISGKHTNTTHNRMELTAVIEALKYLRENYHQVSEIRIISDSQYVLGLTGRKEKLNAAAFKTKKGCSVQNADLVKNWFELSELFQVELVKIKAHQKKDASENFNREADKLVRAIVREGVKNLTA